MTGITRPRLRELQQRRVQLIQGERGVLKERPTDKFSMTGQEYAKTRNKTGIAGIADEPAELLPSTPMVDRTTDPPEYTDFQGWADGRSFKATVERHAAYAALDEKKSDFHQILRNMGEVHDRKNSDYANSDTDRYKNFRLCEMAGISAFDGCLTRLSDKFARVMNLAEKARRDEGPAVRDESIEDTLLDMANYAVIALILHRQQRATK